MSFPNPRLMPGGQALGQNVGDPYWFDDFIDGNEVIDHGGKFSETANQAQWLMTVIDTDSDNGESIVPADAEPGGVVTISNNVDMLDSLEFQKNGEAWKVAAGKDIYFEARLKVDDADDVRWAIGLATTDTTVMDLTGSGYTNILTSTEFIGFAASDAADGNVDYLAADGHSAASTTTFTSGDTGYDMADDTFVTLAFHVVSNKRIKFYVNGEEKGVVSATTYIPDTDEVSLWYTIANDGTTDGSAVIEIDYIYCTQAR